MDKHYIFVLISIAIFSSMGLFVRLISLSGLVVYFFAALVSTIIFAFVLMKERRLKAFFTKKHFWIPILIGVFGVINNVAYFYAYNLTTISNATFVHYLAPVIIAVLAPILLSEKTQKKVWYAIFVSLLGLFILTKPNAFSFTSKNSFGLFLAFISAFGYSMGVLFFRKASKFYSSKEILFSQMFFSVIILFPFVLYMHPVFLFSDFLLLLILGFVHQGIAVLLMIKALKMLPSQNVSVITYLEPVGATILALLFLGEIPSLATLLGGGMILFSCYLILRN